MHSQSKTVHEIMIRIINKVSSLMAEPRDFGIDELLHNSEIHMVDMIGRNPGINVTEIAQKLGITKGAIPKIIRKLIQKGLIYRYQSKDNKRIGQFELTAKGQIAFQQHIEFHRNFDNIIIQTFDSVSEEKLHFLNEIMSEVEQHIDKIRQSK
ncbi:hypothetical protein SPSIL_053750 [Sporomusa silvacetica DSM 10669]|uniref:HTH marR-type domain-containing protein n=1 Tax=Sporomusa silvacetica DSM 10669 TaxID=1123289 RepID=A0ABZ3ITV3_9FIRM|nr:MarR family protein [Sporomusa silvacetica DSM 10669]